MQVATGGTLARTLDRYLAEGYDIKRAADGWGLLRNGDNRIAPTKVRGN
jgi:hypothetical protein